MLIQTLFDRLLGVVLALSFYLGCASEGNNVSRFQLPGSTSEDIIEGRGKIMNLIMTMLAVCSCCLWFHIFWMF